MSRNIASLSMFLILSTIALLSSTGVSALSSLGTDFVGSTTNADFLFYANNTERLRITTTGYVRISTGYLDYSPGGTACTNGQILSYNTASTRWQCASDSQGVSGTGANNAMAKWVGNGTGATLSASTNVFESGGFVGIGTASPVAQLHVLGNAYLTGGNIGIRSVTPLYGIDVLGSGSGGMVSTQSGFCINGTCINTWQGLNNIVTSMGNPNYIAKFGSTGSLSNSQLYETGSKLYIGDVPSILAGTATSSYGYITMETFGSTNSSNPLMTLSENGGQECRLWIAGANKMGSNCEWVGGVSGYSFTGNTIIRSDATGIALTGSIMTDNGTNIGISTLSPDLKLVIADTTATNRVMRVQRGTQAADASMITGYGTPYINIGGLENRVNSLQTIGFGYSSLSGALRYAPAEIGFLTTSVAGNTQGAIVFANRNGTTNVAPTEMMRITSIGAVGIGTTTPGAKLEVSGTVKIVDGSQGSGKVLTSDANGLASWGAVPDELPVGSVMPFNLAACPAGWVAANGTSGTPDLRGEFIRGLDSGRGVDIGRILNSWQDQDWKGFYQTDTGQAWSAGYAHNDVYMGKSTTGYIGALFTGYWQNPSAAIGTKWDTSEVRPRNVALLYCTKLSSTSSTPSNNVTWTNVTGTSSGNVALATTGNVGIGTATPSAKLAVNAIGVIGGANQSAYDIGAGRIAAGQSIYSYGKICAGNSLGDCNGVGGFIADSGGAVTINNTSPTMYFQDTDNRSAMIHNNSNLLYILRGCGNNSPTWCTGPNGWWPLYINLENNDAIFGGNVSAFQFLYNSDRRLKKNIVPLKNSLDKIISLSGYSFDWKSTGKRDIGVIAQEVEKVFPDIVHENSDASGKKFKSVEYGNLIAPVIEAIKELTNTVKSNTREIDALKSENIALKKRLDAIEARLAK